MKRHLKILTTSIILVGALTAGALPQSAQTQALLANIPFAFNVGAKNLPAGRYTITVLNPTSDQRVLQVRSIDGRFTAITLTTAVIGNESKKGKLIFRRYGNQYFFAQAQMAGESTGLAAAKSSAERAQAVVSAAKSSIVVVAAN